MTPIIIFPKSIRQWYRFRHFDLARIRHTGHMEKMVGLIHNSIEHLVQLPTICLTLLPGGVFGHIQIAITIQSNNAGKSFGYNGSIPTLQFPIPIRAPNHRNYWESGAFGQVDDSKFGNESRSSGRIRHQSAIESSFYERFHFTIGLSPAPG